ncbi:MAG TPA: dihydrofolate reductase [Bacteroidota bacterium]|nr:dihydrofolate reductase [Bacteroidota bacterium]
MKLAIIAAIARNRAIGAGGTLPWHLSDDLKRFKRLTTGHAVLMGRKTFVSLGRPLPNRRNVVLSRSPVPGVETYPSVSAALNALAEEEWVFVIGGGDVYRQLLDRADRLYLTRVDRDVEADTYFPEYEHLLSTVYTLVASEQREGYRFEDYVRRDAESGSGDRTKHEQREREE